MECLDEEEEEEPDQAISVWRGMREGG